MKKSFFVPRSSGFIARSTAWRIALLGLLGLGAWPALGADSKAPLKDDPEGYDKRLGEARREVEKNKCADALVYLQQARGYKQHRKDEMYWLTYIEACDKCDDVAEGMGAIKEVRSAIPEMNEGVKQKLDQREAHWQRVYRQVRFTNRKGVEIFLSKDYPIRIERDSFPDNSNSQKKVFEKLQRQMEKSATDKDLATSYWLPFGVYRIEGAMQEETTIADGLDAQIIQLDIEPPCDSITCKWWFWPIVTAALTSAVAATVAATCMTTDLCGPPPPPPNGPNTVTVDLDLDDGGQSGIRDYRQ